MADLTEVGVPAGVFKLVAVGVVVTLLSHMIVEHRRRDRVVTMSEQPNGDFTFTISQE